MHNTPVALITGASRGIGAAIALEFAANGYDLILTCNKSMDLLQALCDGISEKYHVTCTPVQADMSKEADVESLFQNISQLDVLVNNVGISYIGLLSGMTWDAWQNVINTNLTSCFLTCRSAIPLMLQDHAGRIINISSVWGNVGASMETAYSASKGGMNALTKALAKELAPSNIQVNAIACGVIDTTMNACFTEEEKAALQGEIPADRFGKPEEVAQLAFHLAQAPDYLTGQIITLDGGWI